MTGFHRFPHTPHLAWLRGGEPRDDKVLAPFDASALLAGPVRVEEKIDGANLGISVGADGRARVQNRGEYLDLPYLGQFSRLGAWLAIREAWLRDALGRELILFGEWCAALHSVPYDALPDWFIAFDVYDRRVGGFWSAERRNLLCETLGLAVVPTLRLGEVSLETLVDWVQTKPSAWGPKTIEGVVVRRENHDWLAVRAKLVRPGFIQTGADHWRRRVFRWNRLSYL